MKAVCSFLLLLLDHWSTRNPRCWIWSRATLGHLSESSLGFTIYVNLNLPSKCVFILNLSPNALCGLRRSQSPQRAWGHVLQVTQAAQSSSRILHIYLMIYMCSKLLFFYGLFCTCHTYSWERDSTSVALTEVSFFMPSFFPFVF